MWLEENEVNEYIAKYPNATFKDFVEHKRKLAKDKIEQENKEEQELQKAFAEQVVGKYVLINFNDDSFRFIGPITMDFCRHTNSIMTNTEQYDFFYRNKTLNVSIIKKSHVENPMWYRSLVTTGKHTHLRSIKVLSDDEVNNIKEILNSIINRGNDISQEFINIAKS